MVTAIGVATVVWLLVNIHLNYKNIRTLRSIFTEAKIWKHLYSKNDPWGHSSKNLNISRIRLSEIQSIFANEGSLILRKISPRKRDQHHAVNAHSYDGNRLWVESPESPVKSCRFGGYLGFLVMLDVPRRDLARDAINQPSTICVVVVPTTIGF